MTIPKYENRDKYGRVDTDDHVERDALCRYNTGEGTNLYEVNEKTKIATARRNERSQKGWNYASEVENIKYTKY